MIYYWICAAKNDGDHQVVMLASGDPFWFGAGTQITRHLEAGEWQALPGASCFSLAASQLGWAIEQPAALAFTPRLSAAEALSATEAPDTGNLARWQRHSRAGTLSVRRRFCG